MNIAVPRRLRQERPIDDDVLANPNPNPTQTLTLTIVIVSSCFVATSVKEKLDDVCLVNAAVNLAHRDYNTENEATATANHS